MIDDDDEALRRLQAAEDDRLDALDRRDREGEKAPAAEALFGGPAIERVHTYTRKHPISRA